MKRMKKRFAGIARVFRLWKPIAEQVTEDVEEEIRTHLDLRSAELEATGLTETEARRQALNEFGDLERARRNLGRESRRRERRRRGLLFTGGIGQDVVQALRQLVRNPGFSLVVILTLALGIGANTAIFSVVRGVIMRPLEYAEPGSLVMIASEFPAFQAGKFTMSGPEFLELRERSRAFEEMGAYFLAQVSIEGGVRPTRVSSASVSEEVFRVLGRAPALGRYFTPEEDTPQGEPVVVLSHELWQRAFGGGPTWWAAPFESTAGPRPWSG